MAAQEHRDRWLLRSLLALGVLFGVVLIAYFLVPSSVQPNHRPLGRDFFIYYAAAEAFLRGEAFVGFSATPGVRGATDGYVYPPVTILAFVPYAVLFDRTTAFVVHALLDVAAMLGVAGLVVRTVERHVSRLPTIDRLLIGGFCVSSALSTMAIGLGQIDPLVALALAGAFVAVEAERESVAGLAVAVAGVFKLVPILVGVWLLYRRAWRAVWAAVGLGALSVASSFLLFGIDPHVRFVRHVLQVRSRLVDFEGASASVEFSVTLAQPMAFLVPDLDPMVYPVVTLLVLAPVLAFVYRRSRDVTDRLVAFLGTLCAVILVSPASNFTWIVSLYYPMLTLLYLVDHRRSWWLYLAGVGTLAVPFQRYQPRAIAEIAGVADAYTATVGPVLETVLGFGTVPLYGIVLLLVGSAVASAGSSDREEYRSGTAMRE